MTMSGEESDSTANHTSGSSEGDYRRPIVTHGKPGRGRALSRHYKEEVVQRQYVVEDGQGRKFFYNTKDEAIAKADRLDYQQRMNAVEAFQASKRGPVQPPMGLTVENVKRASSTQQRQQERAASYVSDSSKKGTTSTRLSTSESTIQITDVFSIPGDRTAEITTKDGETAVVGPGSPSREKNYRACSARLARNRIVVGEQSRNAILTQEAIDTRDHHNLTLSNPSLNDLPGTDELLTRAEGPDKYPHVERVYHRGGKWARTSKRKEPVVVKSGDITWQEFTQEAHSHIIDFAFDDTLPQEQCEDNENVTLGASQPGEEHRDSATSTDIVHRASDVQIKSMKSTSFEDVSNNLEPDDCTHSIRAETAGFERWHPLFPNGEDAALVLPEPGIESAPSTVMARKSFICVICGRQLQSRPSLRHHLATHDPFKMNRYRCDHEGCTYTSRYSKDMRRHALVHKKPIHLRFVCREPDCDRIYTRNLKFLQHRQREHPESVANASVNHSLTESSILTASANALPNSQTDPSLPSPTFASDMYHSLPRRGNPWHTRLAPSAGRGIAQVHDVDEDDMSDAESVFSQASATSTATSLGGSLGAGGFFEMVSRTTSVLFAGGVVQSINFAALEDPGIGPERYRRNIRRMIKTFGKSLRAEADTLTEHRVALAMQTRRISTHVAHEIMTRVESPRPSRHRTRECNERTNEEQHSDTSTESADENELASTQEPDDEAKILAFILDSNACMQFKRTLMDFVHKPYEKRIITALDSSLNGTSCHDRDYLVRAAREISWVPTNLLCFSQDHFLTVTDHFKGCIEDVMGETWNWSPFTARRYPLQADCCRLSWKLPNGEARYIDLPKDVEGAVQRASDTAPNFLNQVDLSGCHTISAMGNSVAGTTGNSAPRIPFPIHQAGAGSASSSHSGPQMPLQSLQPPASWVPSSIQQCGQIAQVPQNSHHVYLCVEAGSREFFGLDCAGIQTDIQFFDRIKSEYNAARGWFRLWFSTWRYDHCEFMQFQKTGIGLGARLKIAFPEPTDPLYDYLPKPLESLQLPPHGPISPDEFRLHYYYQVCPSLLSWERWHRRRTGLSLVEKEAFEVAPKRVVKLDMQNGRREKFYGLYAKEARSALRVAIHMSVCCLPGVIFFFLWLYQWGHGADLQGAAVPVQLSLTLVAGYLGVLYWTR